MKRTLVVTILAGALASSFAATQVATGGTGLPVETGGSATHGEGSHGTGAYDTNDATRGTKGQNEQLRRKDKRQMGNEPADKSGNPIQSAPDQPRGTPAGESDDSD